VDRRPVTRTLLAAGAALLAALAVASCSNPIDIVGAVTTEVKVANNKFLIVSNMGPFSQNDQAVNPGTTIWIQFDRDLDPTSVSNTSVTIVPAATWTFDYSEATKTLTIKPGALESLTTYTVTVGNGLKGADGSDLQANYTFSFKTKLAPVGSMTINSGEAYTNSTGTTLHFSVNGTTSQIRYSLDELDLTADPSGGDTLLWTPKGSATPSFPLTLTGSDGATKVYYQFVDAFGLAASPGYDGLGQHPLSTTITLDRVAPSIGSFSINGGALTSSDTNVTLNNSVSDATSPIEMNFMNTATGVWSGWEDYSATRGWSLPYPGTRQVVAQFRDKAGNTTSTTSDAIIAGAPTAYNYMNYHGYASVGNTYLYWGINSPDVGTDTYYLVYRYHFHPEYGWYGWTTTTSTYITIGTSAETVWDYAVMIGSNTAVGTPGYGAPYSNDKPIFTAAAVVIYNDGNSTDTALATQIRTVLRNTDGWIAANSVNGSLPYIPVQLIPQSFVSSTVNSSYNIIWGYPTIITPGVSRYGETGFVYNAVAHGRGVVAMGPGGLHLLDTISTNANGYYYGQLPNQLGWSHSYYTGNDSYAYARSVATVWNTPLYRTTLTENQQLYIGVALQDLSISISGGAPTGGEIYSTDYTYTSYANIARQGRYVHYGYPALAGVGYPAWVFSGWVDMIYRMGENYW